MCGSMALLLAHLEFELGDPGSIPGSCHYSISHLGQVVYSHCLPSFSVTQLQETGVQKGSFRRLSGYGD